MNARFPTGTSCCKRPAVALLLLLFALASLLQLYQGIRAGWADAITLKTRRDLARASSPPTPVAWLEYRNQLKSGLAATPDNPEFHDYLGYLYASRGYLLHRVGQPSSEYFTQAQYHYRESIRLRPISPFAWAGSAVVLHYLDEDAQGMWQAFDMARNYGPHEPGVATLLAELGYPRAAELTPARRDYLAQSYKNADGTTRARLAKLAGQHGVNPLTLFPLPAPEGVIPR